MGYSIDSLTAGCYPGSTVLINKFNIRDESKLNEIEAVLSSAGYTSWETKPIENSFSFEHYKTIHRFLFSDLYEWAGEIRTVDNDYITFGCYTDSNTLPAVTCF